MAKFSTAPVTNETAAQPAGWEGDFFDRLGAFWADNGDLFSPFTRIAFLAMVALFIVLVVRGLWRTFSGRGARDKMEDEVES